MAAIHMSDFFINANSIDRLEPAPDDRRGVHHTFPYPHEVPPHMVIRYHHDGQMAWSAPSDTDIQILILITRIPAKQQEAEYYRLWAFRPENFARLISDAGKISSGNIQAALSISDEIPLNSADIENYGAEFFQGTYEQTCEKITVFIQEIKAKAGDQS